MENSAQAMLPEQKVTMMKDCRACIPSIDDSQEDKMSTPRATASTMVHCPSDEVLRMKNGPVSLNSSVRDYESIFDTVKSKEPYERHLLHATNDAEKLESNCKAMENMENASCSAE
jgi:hypothetical protein